MITIQDTIVQHQVDRVQSAGGLHPVMHCELSQVRCRLCHPMLRTYGSYHDDAMSSDCVSLRHVRACRDRNRI